jgi:hypothetical protein
VVPALGDADPGLGLGRISDLDNAHLDTRAKRGLPDCAAIQVDTWPGRGPVIRGTRQVARTERTLLRNVL